MLTTVVSLTKPGDKVMRLSTQDGGHFATERLCYLVGRKSCCFAFDRNTFRIDIDGTKKILLKEKPTLLYIDNMTPLFPVPVSELSSIAGSIPIIYDGSHVLGLIAGGQFQDPLSEGASILQGNTHKTFFGPQKALILGRDRELMDEISYNMSSALVSSEHTAELMSLFVSLHEIRIHGESYAKSVVKNAKYLAEALYERGFDVLAADHGFTESHMFLLDVKSLGSGLKILEKLLKAHISANRVIPFKHVDAIRVGVQEITRRGYTKENLDQIAEWFDQLLLKRKNPSVIRKEVEKLVLSRRKIFFCEDINKKDRKLTRSRLKNKLNEKKTEKKRKPRWADFTLIKGRIHLDEKRLNELRKIASLASALPQQVDAAGNISVRIPPNKIIVKVSGSFMKHLEHKDFVEILDEKPSYNLVCRGIGPPSAEAYMHWLIYEHTKSNFVVHAHYFPSNREIRKLNIFVVPPIEYGSIKLAESVAEACKRSNIVYVRRHGIIVHSKSPEGCVDLLKALSTRRRS
jgi:fluorothreonine transaldolase